MHKLIDFLADIVKLVLVSLVIVLPVRYFLFQPFYVSGASMEPNFFDNEYLIIDEISYRFNDPVRGDIVVFKNPDNRSESYIKRIIGLPGEKLEIRKKSVKIYNSDNPEGVVLDEPYLEGSATTYSFVSSVIELSSDEYFVMGDNRSYSRDSRVFGPIKSETIVGKVVLRGWPFDRLGVFGRTEYGF